MWYYSSFLTISCRWPFKDTPPPYPEIHSVPSYVSRLECYPLSPVGDMPRCTGI